MTGSGSAPASVRQSKSRLALVMVIAVCLAPVLASYYFYYVDPPEGRTNSGTLILPPREVLDEPVVITMRPETESGFLDVLAQRSRQPEAHQPSLSMGQTARLGDFRGRWLMVWTGPDPCDQVCLEAMVSMRQIRLTTGRDRDRVERVWLRVGAQAGQPSQPLPAGLEGTWQLTSLSDPQPSWAAQLPQDQQAGAFSGLWLIDPQGHLMMHFPRDTDPARIKKDLIRLLKASRVG